MKSDTSKQTTLMLMIIILLAAFVLRQYRLLDFPYHGDEVNEGDIALDMLSGHLALYYPQNGGNEPLYQFTLTPFFAIVGDSVISNRWPSAAWSTLFVALMYLYGRILFRRRRVGLMAAGLTAALWWPTVFGRLGLREISQPVMMTPALIGLVMVFCSSKSQSIKAGIVGGIFAGLTTYTFLSGRGFPVIAICFLGYIAIAHRPLLLNRWRPLLFYFALMFVLSAPLHIYLAMRPELEFHVRELAELGWTARSDFGEWIVPIRDTLGMFTVSGDMNWVRNIPGRPVFVGLEGVLFYGGVVLCLWRWREPQYVLQLIVIAVMLVPNILTHDPPRWTRAIGILPGLMAITVLPVEWGWRRLEAWTRFKASINSFRVSATYICLVAFLGITLYARTAFDMFRVWIDHPGVYWMMLAFYDGAGKYVNASSDSTPFNYVFDFYEDWRKNNVARVVQRPDVALRWSEYSAFVLPDDPRGNRVAFQILGAPATPLLYAFLDLDAPLHIDPRIEPEGRRLLRVYFIPRERLEEHLAQARQGGIFLPDSLAPISIPINVEASLEFLGYKVYDESVRANSSLHLLTYWRVLRPPPPTTAVFVHLLDAEEKILAQSDRLQVVVENLAPGDIIVQLHTLELPADLPPGAFRLALGVYVREDQRRLPLSVGSDYILLETWRPPPKPPVRAIKGPL